LAGPALAQLVDSSALAELVDENRQRGDGGANRRALGSRQLVQGIPEAEFMSLLPALQLSASGIRQSHDSSAPIGWIRRSLRGTSLDELLHKPTRGGRREMQLGANLPDSDAIGLVVAQALQEFDLRHRQRLPRVVVADAGT
jgi:hypothetical protein